jgi:serine/threonine-protein kinase HipA
MTRRFDRDGNRKHHVQTLCGLCHLDFRQRASHAYEQLFRAALELRLGDLAMNQLFRRMAFNVAARNCDDHTKNFGFILRQGAGWELAPAYDVTHAYNPKGEWTNQHLTGVNGKFAGITRDDFLAIAERFGIGTAPRVMKRVSDAIGGWKRYAEQAGLSSSEAERIRQDHHSGS